MPKLRLGTHDGKLCFPIRGAGKQSFPRRVPKQSLGTRSKDEVCYFVDRLKLYSSLPATIVSFNVDSVLNFVGTISILMSSSGLSGVS